MAAVQIHGARRLAVNGIRVRIRIRVQPDAVASIAMVLVIVVTEVFRPGLGLVPTVRRHRCPAELERQKGEQDDGEDATHGPKSSGYRVPRCIARAAGPWRFTTCLPECAALQFRQRPMPTSAGCA